MAPREGEIIESKEEEDPSIRLFGMLGFLPLEQTHSTNLVKIKHPDGNVTTIQHLSPSVRVGDYVKQGTILGQPDGYAGSPHLHVYTTEDVMFTNVRDDHVDGERELIRTALSIMFPKGASLEEMYKIIGNNKDLTEQTVNFLKDVQRGYLPQRTPHTTQQPLSFLISQAERKERWMKVCPLFSKPDAVHDQ